MILGKITGKISTTHFQFSVTHPQAKKFQFVQVAHPEHGFVLCQIMEMERNVEEMTARCQIIGFKDVDGRIKGLRTPFNLNTEVLEAEDDFIKSIIELGQEGGFLGYLEGKNIPIRLDLQKVLTKHLCVLAKSGAGKSYAVGVLVEEILDKKVPLLIIDPHGEYSSLSEPNEEEREKLAAYGLEPTGYHAQIQEYGDPKLREELRPLRLNEKMSSYELMKLLPLQLTNTQEAMIFSVIKDLPEVNFDNIILGLEQLNSPGKWGLIDIILYLRDLKIFSPSPTPFQELLRPGKATIINLKGIAPEIQDVIVYKLLKDLFAERKAEKVPPFFCILEEAHNFAPERGFGKAKSGDVIRLISSEGRKFGLGLCVISQRPALVQKTILAQCSTQIILKITNPNDLKAVTSSLEGITPETEEEIQNLPVGSALVCGMVDRPLVVNIRTRKSKHGGHAVDILGSAEKSVEVHHGEIGKNNLTENENSQSPKRMGYPLTAQGVFKVCDTSHLEISNPIIASNGVSQTDEEYAKDVFVETQKFAEENLLCIIPSRLSIKDIQLMSSRPPKKITTYLIPALFFNCEQRGNHFNLLVDRIRGKIIIDPEKEITKNISEANSECHFLRQPVYAKVEFNVQLEEKIPMELLKTELEKYCVVLDFRECWIVYHKTEF